MKIIPAANELKAYKALFVKTVILNILIVNIENIIKATSSNIQTP
jgi:hypothetical protein